MRVFRVFGQVEAFCDRCQDGMRLWSFNFHTRVYGDAEWIPRELWNVMRVEVREDRVMGFFDRVRLKEDRKGANVPIKDDQSLKAYPTLCEVMAAQTTAAWGETNRCSLSLFQQEGAWKGILRDKEDGVCLWVTCQTLIGLLKSLEAALGNPETVWRADRYAGSETAKRQKRKG